MNLSDELAIIKKCIAGNQSAFAVLVNKYQELAITLAYNIVLNRQEAEDIAQEAFIKAYSGLKTFKGNARFSTWFYRIVLNTALNAQKRSKLILDDIPEDNLEIVGDYGNYEQNEDQRKYIKQAMSILHEAERVCITMYYLNELSVAEISDVSGFSTSNIKVLLHRGRKHLYAELHRILNHEMKDLI